MPMFEELKNGLNSPSSKLNNASFDDVPNDVTINLKAYPVGNGMGFPLSSVGVSSNVLASFLK